MRIAPYFQKFLHLLGARSYFAASEKTFSTLTLADVARLIEAFLDRDETFCEPDTIYEFISITYRAEHLSAAKAEIEAIQLRCRTNEEPDGFETARGREELRALAARLGAS